MIDHDGNGDAATTIAPEINGKTAAQIGARLRSYFRSGPPARLPQPSNHMISPTAPLALIWITPSICAGSRSSLQMVVIVGTPARTCVTGAANLREAWEAAPSI